MNSTIIKKDQLISTDTMGFLTKFSVDNINRFLKDIFTPANKEDKFISVDDMSNLTTYIDEINQIIGDSNIQEKYKPTLLKERMDHLTEKFLAKKFRFGIREILYTASNILSREDILYLTSLINDSKVSYDTQKMMQKQQSEIFYSMLYFVVLAAIYVYVGDLTVSNLLFDICSVFVRRFIIPRITILSYSNFGISTINHIILDAIMDSMYVNILTRMQIKLFMFSSRVLVFFQPFENTVGRFIRWISFKINLEQDDKEEFFTPRSQREDFLLTPRNNKK